jgi:predicted kinase
VEWVYVGDGIVAALLWRTLETRMPTLHLICGLPGAGKTTLARRLERDLPALRLAPDEWMARIVGDGYDEAKRAAVEAVQWEIAARALSLGVDVILENGFWSRSERDDYRSWAAAAGAETRVHFLDVPRDELLRRLARRNAALPPDTFRVDEAQLDLWSSWFEPPTPDELE